MLSRIAHHAVFLVNVWYVSFRYGMPTSGSAIPTAKFASWAVMPADVRICTIIGIVTWAVAMGAMFRLFLLNIAIKEQPLTDFD